MLARYTQRNLTWVDLVAPSEQEVRDLMKEFGFHPAVGQELMCASVKSKVDRYDDSLYMVLQFPMLRGTHHRYEQEIDFVIGKNYLITARYEHNTPLHAFAKAFEANGVLGKEGVSLHGGHLFAALARNLYGALMTECDTIRHRLDEIEEHIFVGKERSMVIEISQVGRAIYDFRQALLPHNEMLTSLEAPIERMFGREFSYYMSGVMGEYERIQNKLENLRDSLIELRETNNSLLSTKQNEIMKTFTVIAFLFLPLSFINGLFQMNTHDTPIVGTPHDFWFILAGMAVVAVSCFVYFKRKGWL